MITNRLKIRNCEKKIRQAVNTRLVPEIEPSGKACLLIDAEKLGDSTALIKLRDALPVINDDLEVVICGAEFEIPRDLKYQVLDPAEVNWKAGFKNEAISRLTGIKFDFMVCNLEANDHCGLLLASVCEAGIKIGAGPDPFGIYDVEIRTQEPKVFQEETLKYLEILKKE